ncbi:MAG TPA: hypothetical protein DCZ95_15895 [Verrucomicrobia bacterium]|nr:MAG: hypothetical protein A2X46_00050 [Lentisphaerae bacterium GWF2_57_35]HBA85565.1 hypothetical protein [Verrucomicrobiota bacterium]
MAGGTNRKSPLDLRLKELQKEAEAVRDDMKVLSRALKKPDSLENLPRLKSNRRPPPVRPGVRRDPVEASREKNEMPPPEIETPGGGELFAWAPRRNMVTPPDTSGQHAYLGDNGSAVSSDRNRPKVMNDERFRNYFGNGSFIASRPLKQEKQIQRNKAIFMVCVVLFFGFIVLKLLLR